MLYVRLEANGANLGRMYNTGFDLQVLSAFGIRGYPAPAPAPAPGIKRIKWQLPPMDVMKVNVDGSAAGTMSGGGIFRDSFSVCRGCFAMSLGSGFAFEAELATSLHAIGIAHDFGWTGLWMECDSLYVVQTLTSKNPVIS
ncbi:hypothetical protein ACS0TY_005004 [Phlomoides rotata]